jgi:hypothetical protein
LYLIIGKAQQVYRGPHNGCYNACADAMLPNQTRILAKMRSVGLDRLIFAVIFIHLYSKSSQLLRNPILN